MFTKGKEEALCIITPHGEEKIIFNKGERKMRSGQYKNAIHYALTDEANYGKDNLELTRSILGNMGVSLPKGDYRNVLCTLISGKYGGWKQCLKEQARAYANYGYAAIGLTKEDVVVIEPDANMGARGVYESTNPVARTVDEISQEDMLDMQFFIYAPTPNPMAITTFNSYNYGYDSGSNPPVGCNHCLHGCIRCNPPTNNPGNPGNPGGGACMNPNCNRSGCSGCHATGDQCPRCHREPCHCSGGGCPHGRPSMESCPKCP